jgi:hypothetical protein
MDGNADTIKKNAADSAKEAAASAEKAEEARVKTFNASTAAALDKTNCKRYAENALTDANAAKEATSSAQTFATNAEKAAEVATEAKGEAEGAARAATEAKDDAKKHADNAKQHAETGKQNWDTAVEQLRATEQVHKNALDLNYKTVSAEATILKLEQNKSSVELLARCKPIADALQDIGDPEQVANNLRLVNEYMPCFRQLKELGSPEAVSGMIETIKGTDLSQLSETVKCLSAGPEACRRKRSADEMQERKALYAQLAQGCQAVVGMNETMSRLVGKFEDCLEPTDKKRQRTMNDEYYG